MASRIVDFPAPIGPTTPTRRRPRRSKVVRPRYERNPWTVSSRGRIGHPFQHLAEQPEQVPGGLFPRVPPVVVGVLLLVARPRPLGAGAAFPRWPVRTDVDQEGEGVRGAPTQVRVDPAYADGQVEVGVAKLVDPRVDLIPRPLGADER